MGFPAYSGDGIAIEYDSLCLSGYQFGGGGLCLTRYTVYQSASMPGLPAW